MESYKIHPFANQFPAMSEKEFESLKNDIKQNGLKEPITLFENQILDGRNRYRACNELGVEATLTAFEGSIEQATAFSISRNLQRRHLSTSQRAMYVAKFILVPEREAKEKERGEKRGYRTGESAIRRLSDRFAISHVSLYKALYVYDHDPARATQILNGELSVAKAEQEIRDSSRFAGCDRIAAPPDSPAVDEGANQAGGILVANRKFIEQLRRPENQKDFERNCKQACILFADLIGCTAYKYTRAPAVGLEKTLRHNLIIEEIIESSRWHGEVIKFVGDGVVALFMGHNGDPKDAASRAINAAMHIIRRFRNDNRNIPDEQWFERIDTKIGIHVGPAWMMQFKQKRRVDPQGPTVDIAARLVDIAPQMHAIMTEATFEAAGFNGSVPCQPSDECKWSGPAKRRLPGVSGLQRVFAVTPDDPAVVEIPLPGALPPTFPEVRSLLNRARSLAKGDGAREAADIYRKILSKDSRNFEANYYLAELLCLNPDLVKDEGARLREAYERLCEAKSERPHSCNVWILLSWVQFLKLYRDYRLPLGCDGLITLEYLDDAVRYATHALNMAEGFADSHSAANAMVHLVFYLTERVRNGMLSANDDQQRANAYVAECHYMLDAKEKYSGLLASNFCVAQAMALHATHFGAPGGIPQTIMDGILGLLQQAASHNDRNRLAVEFRGTLLNGENHDRLRPLAGA